MKRLIRILIAIAVAFCAVVGVEIVIALRREYLPTEPVLDIGGSFGGPSADALKLTVLGDSTGAGVGAGDAAHAYPTVLAERLSDLGYRVELRCHAVSGARVGDVLGEQVPLALLDDPDIVFVAIGANDVTHWTSLSEVEDDMRTAIEKLKASGAQVVVAGAPDMRASAFLEPLRSIVGWRGRRVAAAIGEAAEDANVPLVPLAEKTAPFFVEDPERYYSADDFHPSADGYERWADAIFPFLREAVAAHMTDPQVTEAIEAGDMNALLRIVDAYCAARRWDDLIDVADLCEEAVERGKQLWPIAAHIDYRVALEGPPEQAAAMLDSELGRFTLGPLSEVAASTHTWAELAPHITSPVSAAYVGQERVLRGEDLRRDPLAHAEVLELPLKLEDWEPTYPLAVYRSNLVEVPEPWIPKAPLAPAETSEWVELDEPEIAAALLELVQPWTTESNGAARAVVVEGTASEAVSALAFDVVRMGQLGVDEAIQRMAWAAASGGAHGRRRGAALGRSLAWHTATLLADLDWPPEPAELHRALESLKWFRWDEGAEEEGWVLRLALEDPEHGWAAALAATDLLEEV